MTGRSGAEEGSNRPPALSFRNKRLEEQFRRNALILVSGVDGQGYAISSLTVITSRLKTA